MDEKDKEIARLKQELEAKNAELNTTKESLTKSEEARRKQGQNFKKLRDMTEDEKSRLSDFERELLERQENIEKQQEAFEAEQKAFRQTERNATIDRYVKKLANGDEAFAKELTDTFNKYHGEVIGEDAIKEKILESYTVVKKAVVPDNLRQAFSSGGNGQEPNINPNGEGQSEEDKKAISSLEDSLGFTDMRKANKTDVPETKPGETPPAVDAGKALEQQMFNNGN